MLLMHKRCKLFAALGYQLSCLSVRARTDRQAATRRQAEGAPQL